MRWNDAMEAVLLRLRGDAALTSALGGGPIERASGAAPPSPGIVYTVTSSRRTETEEVVFTRWDVRAATLAGVVAAEARLNALLDRRGPEDVEGVEMWPEFVDAWDVPEAAAGSTQRTALFRFTVPRDA